MAKKATATKKTAKKAASGKYNFLNIMQENLANIATVSKSGEVKFKRAELKQLIESTFEEGAKKAAAGERVKFPFIGTLVRRDVKGRKAGKGVNPFTGEPMTIKARPESKKPRWSFPKNVKEVFSKKTNW